MSTFSFVILVTLIGASTASLLLRSPYQRPICSPNESCLTSAFGLRLGMCDCPGANPRCPETNPVNHNDVDYHFCEPRKIAICQDGEIASSVRNFSMLINCLCPEGQRYLTKRVIGRDRVDYVCGIREICRPSDRCEVMVSGIGQRPCDCPSGTWCVPADSDYPQAGTCA
ncbi:hypothetical protein QR680_002051 [Steinernema hermaphroditum]|uniref:EB domain-containing protein n=1 Tax=Steinernema hermaphroditum TaxID=289476 RepID=A0AA39H1X5_9BILA|nr:hypothetical protein QR680_002051 [Steinernema hermaphroditum]